MNKKIIEVHNSTDLPKEKHFAILSFTTISVPGYDLGDPPESKNIVTYTAYLNQQDWEAEIQERTLSKSRGDWKAIVVEVPRITTQVNVQVET